MRTLLLHPATDEIALPTVMAALSDPVRVAVERDLVGGHAPAEPNKPKPNQ